MDRSVRILIVHDRPEISATLKSIALKTIGENIVVDVAPDVFSARDRLRAAYYDLLIVDLTLPILIGKTAATIENAQILLNDVFEGGEIKAPGDVIGISKDVDVLSLIRTDIGEHLMGCIHEDTGSAWQASYAAKLKYLMRTRNARQIVANSSYDFDLVIITALDKEAQPFSDLFGLTTSDQFERAKQFTFADKIGVMRRGALFSIGLAGPSASAAATQALLTQFRPKLIFMTGFCGGVKRRVRIGDIVAFRNSAPWDNGKWAERNIGGTKVPFFRARATALSGSEGQTRDIVRDLINEECWTEPKHLDKITGLPAASKAQLHLQGAGSGSAVVTSVATLDQITALDESIWAVDMESHAFYHTCRNTPVLQPDFLCIKGVADHCNGAKSSRYHTSCSTLSARLVHRIVRTHYSF